MSAKIALNKEKFVAEYLATGNASTALRAVYPGAEKWKRQSVTRRAHDLMRDPEIVDAIREARAQASREAKVEQAAALRQLARMVFFDVRTVIDERGAVLPAAQWPDAVAMAVTSIEVREEFETTEDGERVLTGYTKRLRFAPRDQAVNMLLKHLGLYERNNRQKGGNPFDDLPADVVEALLARIREYRAAH